MAKKYMFLLSAILYLFGAILGMNYIVNVIITVLLVYVNSILLYICFCVDNEDAFKDILLLSILILTLAIAINDVVGGISAIVLFLVLWFVYRIVKKEPLSEEMIEYGSIVKLYYNTASASTLIMQSILVFVFTVIYLRLNMGIAGTIPI